jgi:serine/threonine-protein kinase
MSDMWDDWDPSRPAAEEPDAPEVPQAPTPPPPPPAAVEPPRVPSSDWPWNDFAAPSDAPAASETPAPPAMPAQPVLPEPPAPQPPAPPVIPAMPAIPMTPQIPSLSTPPTPPMPLIPPAPLAPPAMPPAPAPTPSAQPAPLEHASANAAPVPSAPAGPSFAEGATFGRYLLREYLGRGWQGETWIAEDTFVGCYVSLKLAGPDTDIDAYLHAARFGVQLDDLSGVAMHDLGVVDGRAFLARTLVTDGLVEWLEDNGPLPVGRAISLAGNLASVLDAAHGAGIVHGNVKPANVLFEVADDNNEYGYLVDFLAPPALPGEPRRVPVALIAQTDCMAPEIIDGAPPSPAADQYGLACVIYTMMSGTTPFGSSVDGAGNVEVTLPGATPRALSSLMPMGADPSPEVRAQAAAAADVIARAMSPHPSARYASCAELVETLYAALGSPAQGPSFDGVHAALQDDIGGQRAWMDDDDDDGPMPWDDDFESAFGGASAFNPPPSWDMPNPGPAIPMMPPMPPAANPYGQMPPSGYEAPMPGPYDTPSPYDAPAAYDPYAQPGPSPYDAAPPEYSQPGALGAYPPPTPYGEAYAPGPVDEGHSPWGAPGSAAMGATAPVVMGEHDFDDDGHDGYDEYAEDGHDGYDDFDDGPMQNTRAGESKKTAIVIGVFVAVILIVALFLIIRMFSGSSSAATPTQSSTVATAAPVPTPATPSGLSAPEKAIATQIQPAFVGTCKSSPNAIPGSTAAITCTPSSGASKVTYASFADVNAMNAAYDKQLGVLGAAKSDGPAPAVPCATQRVEERSWRYGTDQTKPADGRYACGPINKIAAMAWTSNRAKMVATAERADLDLKTLGDWWLKNGGPYPASQ